MATPDRSNGQFGLSSTDKAISPAQCRMARALLRWTQRDLAQKAAVARRTVSDFESGLRPLRLRTRRDITNTFLVAGVLFDANGGIRLADAVPARNGGVPVSRLATASAPLPGRAGPTSS